MKENNQVDILCRVRCSSSPLLCCQAATPGPSHLSSSGIRVWEIFVSPVAVYSDIFTLHHSQCRCNITRPLPFPELGQGTKKQRNLLRERLRAVMQPGPAREISPHMSGIDIIRHPPSQHCNIVTLNSRIDFCGPEFNYMLNNWASGRRQAIESSPSPQQYFINKIFSTINKRMGIRV